MAEHIELEAAIEAIMCEPPDAHYPQFYADKIKAIPSADVAPVRRGRWIQGNGYVECSECNTIGSPHWKCCPVCTARMDLEVKNAEE